jgi:cell shape-determining protein MreC
MYLMFLLLSLLSLPEKVGQNIRSFAVASVSPSWSGLRFIAVKTSKLLGNSAHESKTEALLKHVEDLRRENESLLRQMQSMKDWFFHEQKVEGLLSKIQSIDTAQSEGHWKEFLKRRKRQLSTLLELELQSIPAKVVYREPASWSSFVWINVGNKQNKALGRQVIAKNSPVLVGNALVGVVEEVKHSECKVRLITDSNLFPAVRAIRGGDQDQFLLGYIEGVAKLLRTRKDLFESEEEEALLFSFLDKLCSSLQKPEATAYLAKGELKGSSLPLWRSRGQLLKGLGFNYDFADEEGPARDLRTGEVVSSRSEKTKMSLLQEGDLLVTSGFDGLFPAGLEVAVVCKIHCLREGASSYEIEARMLLEHFNELVDVVVLPPLRKEEV